ncbi:MAG: L-cystine-binding protein FliY [Holosporales bacterium]
MKKYLTGVIFAAFAITGCKENKPLSVLVSADYPPFSYIDESRIDKDKKTTVVGFEIDLFNEIAKRLSRKVEYVDVKFDTILSSIQQNKAEAAIANISHTQEREKQVDFSVPYLSSSFALIIKDNHVKSFGDLKGKTLGIQKDTSFESFYHDHYDSKEIGATLDLANTLPDLLTKLKVGKVDAIFTGRAEGLALIEKEKDLIGLKVKGDQENVIAIALPKGSTLKKDVDEAIQNMLKDGTIDTLKKKWGIAL